MSKPHAAGWYEDHTELCHFARVLLATLTSDWSSDDVICYFESPWKWAGEHANWCAAGRPETLHGAPDLRESTPSGSKDDG